MKKYVHEEEKPEFVSDKPELFSILFNKSYISDKQESHLRHWTNQAIDEMIADFIVSDISFQMELQGDPVVELFLDKMDHYVSQLFMSVKYFNPFRKVSDREIDLMVRLIHDNEKIRELPESYQREFVGMLHFAIANSSEGGGTIIW